MKLLVKVIEAKYSDSPQMAVVEMTPEFLETVRKLTGNGSVNFSGEDALGEFYFVHHRDLPSLLKATDGGVKDWDEFTHLILEDEFWSCNWKKIEVHDRSLIYDSSGIYFQGMDKEGFVYLTAPLATTELVPEEVKAAIA
jgi:hypothetical protein